MSRDNRLYAAWVVSLIATLGSLYFSEIRHFNPCVLCWFQRICMYPLAVILGVAALTGDLRVRRYVLPLAGIGVLIALYQNLETWGVVPVLRACTADPSASCGTPWPVWGMNSPLNTVLTIPVLSMIAFTLIIGLLSWRRSRTI
ncbi:putative disulfide formation protein [Deinococcus arenae]|uniref:Putative disulfide formation protein n=1 Tax=Deinococcus arenae TaxID=1452751 RepID=A0A8H9GR56_9DEIO|nr:disulfide bond formation protein B [Deinococcus arenae]AWT35167.1 disulfide bond formation protein B [Deinococcus actinosclerus]GGM44752.1 putative disulfide formation protein [Deinococcus arenae]